MRITRHDHGTRDNVTLFHHHLMRNTSAGWIEIDPVFRGESFDLCVFRQIFRRRILDVVIDGEHRLRRIGDGGCPNLLEFRNHRAGVVMRHHVARANRNEIAAAHLCSGSKSIRMTRRNLLDKCKSHIR